MFVDKISKTLKTSSVYDIPRVVIRQALLSVSSAADSLAVKLEKHKIVKKSLSQYLALNAKYKGLLSGKKCYILGNGPSLCNADLSLLSGQFVLGVNRISAHSLINFISPRFIGLSDPDLFKHPDIFCEWFEEIRRNCSGSTLLLPLESKEVVEKIGLTKDMNVAYILRYGSMADHTRLSFDATKPLPAGENVVQDLILFAIYMQAQQIILLGMDHDFLAQPNDLPKYFSPVYDANLIGTVISQENNQVWSNYHWRIQMGDRTWKSYQNLQSTARELNICIINASEPSFLDVFDRAKFQSTLV